MMIPIGMIVVVTLLSWLCPLRQSRGKELAMPNCSECLMEHVAIVPLRADGSCPCCEKRHALTPDPDAVLARIKRRKENRRARRQTYYVR